MRKWSDEQLMQEVQQGNQRAFRLLIDKHLNALYRVTRRWLGNSSEAEEIVQDTFLRAWHHAGQWKAEQAKLSTWLHKIAHNLCIDHYRRQNPPSVELTEVEEELAIPEGQSDLHRLEQAEQINKALQMLPERQRTAILLCYYEGLSNQEAAEILAIEISALESLLARARRTLRQHLQPEEGG